MSHVLKQQKAHHPNLQRVLDAYGGDAEAALVACLLEIDILMARHEQVSAATSYGYARGSTRRPAAPAVAPTAKTEPLDL